MLLTYSSSKASSLFMTKEFWIYWTCGCTQTLMQIYVYLDDWFEMYEKEAEILKDVSNNGSNL